MRERWAIERCMYLFVVLVCERVAYNEERLIIETIDYTPGHARPYRALIQYLNTHAPRPPTGRAINKNPWRQHMPQGSNATKTDHTLSYKNDHLFFGFAGLSGLVPGAKAASAHTQ